MCNATDLFRQDVTKVCDFLSGFQRESSYTSTRDEIWRQSESPQLPHGVLSRFSLLVSRTNWFWYQTDKDTHKIISIHSELETSESLNERHPLYISNGTAQFYHTHLPILLNKHWRKPQKTHLWNGVPRYRFNRYPLHPLLDCICYMGHYLYCLSKVISSTLLLDNLFVYLTRRYVIVMVQCHVQEALVISKIEIYLQK